MSLNPASSILIAAVFLAACESPFANRADKTRDYGIDSKPLSELKAGIWIDPNGCHHWIIDDGLEGYLSPRLDRDGKPICTGPDMANTAIGAFKGGFRFLDPS